MREKLIRIAKDLDEKSKTTRYAFSVLLGLTLIILLVIGRVNLGNQIRNIEESLVNLIDNARSSVTLFEESLPDLETTFSGINKTLVNFQTSSEKLPQLFENLGTFSEMTSPPSRLTVRNRFKVPPQVPGSLMRHSPF